jgi:tRNA A-37 threonylcarbamoyl transferase component Bud32
MATDSLIGKTLHGDLIIRAKLGEGGMGVVYLGENAYVHDKKYAVKMLRRELTSNPNFQAQFFEEAIHQSKLDHPNIVQMQNYFKDGEDYFLVLAYVEGKTLSEILDCKQAALEEKRALSYIKDLLRALNCAHENAIFHRDVKPSNILIDKTGRARLMDFGIATTAGLHSKAAIGLEVGTAEYMSPEQIRDPFHIDHRADVYSCGIVMFELLTGSLPFVGETRDAIKLQQLECSAPDPRASNKKISKKLAAIVSKALEKDPDRRFQGCVEFLKAIEAYERTGRRYTYVLAAGSVLVAGAYIAKIMLVPIEYSAEATVALAMANYQFLCREVVRLHVWEAQKQLPDTKGNTPPLNREFAKRYAESDANVTKFGKDYADQLARLRPIDRSSVLRILAQDTDDPTREQYQRIIAKDFEEFERTHRSPTREALIQRCP